MIHLGEVSQLGRNGSGEMIDIDLETGHAGQVSKLRWNASRQFIVVHQAVDYHHCITYQVHLQQDLQVLHKLDSKKSEFDQRVTTVILGNVKHTNRSAVRIVSSCNEYPNENEKEDELEAYNRSRFPSLPRVDGI